MSERFIQDGLFAIDPRDGQYHLVGTRCLNCGEHFFPSQSMCSHCQGQEVETVFLGNKGRLYTWTTVEYPPPRYVGPAPYALGMIEVEQDNIVITSRITGVKQDELKIGMPLLLKVGPLCREESGESVISFSFCPEI